MELFWYNIREMDEQAYLQALSLLSAERQGAMVRWIRSSMSCSNLARVSVVMRCLGTPLTGMM